MWDGKIEDWCVLHHPHEGEQCQDMSDIWSYNDGQHHCEGKGCH